MIRSFASKATEQTFNRESHKRIPADIRATAKRKLDQVDAATKLNSLRVPPGNNLKPLERDRKGQHSIKINDQWRICFVWKDGNAYDVDITDYH